LFTVLSNANLRIGFDRKLHLTTTNSPRELPQIKVTKRKEENNRLTKIINMLQPVPEQKESKLEQEPTKPPLTIESPLHLSQPPTPSSPVNIGKLMKGLKSNQASDAMKSI
jgi:hypothetical protein